MTSSYDHSSRTVPSPDAVGIVHSPAQTQVKSHDHRQLLELSQQLDNNSTQSLSDGRCQPVSSADDTILEGQLTRPGRTCAQIVKDSNCQSLVDEVPSPQTQTVMSSVWTQPDHTQPSQLCHLPNQQNENHKSDHGDVHDHRNHQNCSEHVVSGGFSGDNACFSEGHLTRPNRTNGDSVTNSKSQSVPGDTCSQARINASNDCCVPNSNTNSAANIPSIHETDSILVAQTADRKSCVQGPDTSWVTETKTNDMCLQQHDLESTTHTQTCDSSNKEPSHHELLETETSPDLSVPPTEYRDQSCTTKPPAVVTEASMIKSSDVRSESNVTKSVTKLPETSSKPSMTKSLEAPCESSVTSKPSDSPSSKSTRIMPAEDDDCGSSVDPVSIVTAKRDVSCSEREQKTCDERDSGESSENEFEDVTSTFSGDVALPRETRDGEKERAQEQTISHDGEASDEDDEDFFDAWDESENTDNTTANDSSVCQKNTTDEKNQDRARLSSSFTSAREADGTSNRNRPGKRRTWISERPHISHSLWSVLKNCIGKELSKIPLPVNFSEPLSMLQRLTEELEYSEILDHAAMCEDSCEQMAHVAAFTVSSYATTLSRTGKPFNPMLGETFEFDRTSDLGWRSFAEQVSHHPPTLATHAEGRGWTMWQEFTTTIKFRGRYIQIIPRGIAHLTFSGSGNHYTWRKVTTTVHNIIVGRLWVDNEGHMEISNHTTGDTCQLHYSAYSFFSREPHRKVSGTVKDSKEILRWTLTGTWSTQIEAAPILYPPKEEGEEDEEEEEKASSSCYSRPSSKSKSGHGHGGGGGGSGDSQTGPSKVLWKVQPPPEGAEKIYYFSRLAIEMNEPEVGVAPTDSRLRPDQRKMEDGDWEEANSLKFLLEEKQRQARRRREAEAEEAKLQDTEVEEYQPTWFRKEADPITGNTLHVFTGDYWDCKLKQQWDKCPDIFL